jgi:hypothetical protein
MPGQAKVLGIQRKRVGDMRLDALVIDICRHFGLDLPRRALARCMLQVIAPFPAGYTGDVTIPTFEDATSALIRGYVPQGGARRGFSADTQEVVTDVLEPLDEMFTGGELPPVVWPQTVFLRGDRPDEIATGVVELTGGARCLVYGPYLYLPPGRWSARAIVGFDEATYEQSFVMEVHGGEVLARIRAQLPAPGLFSAHLEFYSSKPEAPMELRILMENGAIEGAISFLRVELSRTGLAEDEPPSIPEEENEAALVPRMGSVADADVDAQDSAEQRALD